MRERFAFLLTVLSLSVCACAQEGTVEHGWTDKTNTEMYAAYMLQHAYYEQGYWESKVEIRQAGTKRSLRGAAGADIPRRAFRCFSRLAIFPRRPWPTRRRPVACTRPTG